MLRYLFICDDCGTEEQSEPLEITASGELGLLRDVGWEDLPDGWELGDGTLHCQECK